jgi:hypothetical protein
MASYTRNYGGSTMVQLIQAVDDELTTAEAAIDALELGVFRRTVTSLTAASPDALTAANSGTLYTFNRAAGVAVVLPAIGASDVGIFFDFFFETTATGDHTITAQAADLLKGGVWMPDFNAAVDAATREAIWFAADGTDDLIITMNGTTKGGKVGSWLRLTAASATSWAVEGVVAGDGTIVTPFS